MRRVYVKESIKLDQFLKWANVVSSGGQGKALVKSGMVRVNGRVDQARGRVLADGDVVCVEGVGDLMVSYSSAPGEG